MSKCGQRAQEHTAHCVPFGVGQRRVGHALGRVSIRAKAARHKRSNSVKRPGPKQPADQSSSRVGLSEQRLHSSVAGQRPSVPHQLQMQSRTQNRAK